MWLSNDNFQTIVASTPLFSIDLVIRNPKGEILLGQRLNRPARGSWFVPGGRVLKNESLDTAFQRLCKVELGVSLARKDARLLDLYQHFYQDSVFGDEPDTHYIVAGYLLDIIDTTKLSLPGTQHSRFHWMHPVDMQNTPLVHPHTLAYLDAVGTYLREGF